MITATIENVLNRGLPRSPRARELCAELAGRRLAVEIEGIARLLVESDGQTLRVRRDAETAADAQISGGPFALLGLLGGEPEEPIRGGDVRIDGDALLARRFRELGRLLRPDVEEELALLLGDVPAHRIAGLARGALAWAGRARTTALRNVAEYLAHERRDAVPRAEGEQFLAGVDELREAVDRLEARLAHLESRIGVT